jgi:hypothetical protein
MEGSSELTLKGRVAMVEERIMWTKSGKSTRGRRRRKGRRKTEKRRSRGGGRGREEEGGAARREEGHLFLCLCDCFCLDEEEKRVRVIVVPVPMADGGLARRTQHGLGRDVLLLQYPG